MMIATIETSLTVRKTLQEWVREARQRTFDLVWERTFADEAVYNETLSRMEMYLTSRRRQVVGIERLALTVTLEEGEKIHTENSYK